MRGGSFRRVLRTQALRRGAPPRTAPPGDRPPAVPAVSRCRARQHHGQADTLAAGETEAVKMSQSPGLPAAHCPGWPLQPNGAPHPSLWPSDRLFDPDDSGIDSNGQSRLASEKRRKVLLEQHERGSVPAGQHGPDMPGGLGNHAGNAAQGFGRSMAGRGSHCSRERARAIPAAHARAGQRLGRLGGWAWAIH